MVLAGSLLVLYYFVENRTFKREVDVYLVNEELVVLQTCVNCYR